MAQSYGDPHQDRHGFNFQFIPRSIGSGEINQTEDI